MGIRGGEGRGRKRRQVALPLFSRTARQLPQKQCGGGRRLLALAVCLKCAFRGWAHSGGGARRPGGNRPLVSAGGLGYAPPDERAGWGRCAVGKRGGAAPDMPGQALSGVPRRGPDRERLFENLAPHSILWHGRNAARRRRGPLHHSAARCMRPIWVKTLARRGRGPLKREGLAAICRIRAAPRGPDG